MELVMTIMIIVIMIQTVYVYVISKKQDELITQHNNLAEATFTCISELAEGLDEVETYLEETECQ